MEMHLVVENFVSKVLNIYIFFLKDSWKIQSFQSGFLIIPI